MTGSKNKFVGGKGVAGAPGTSPLQVTSPCFNFDVNGQKLTV